MTAPRSSRPKSDELYTPMTPEVYGLLERMKQEYGTWRRVCEVTGVRARVLRNIRLKHRSITLTMMDRLCSSTGVGHSQDFLWFTAEDLVALGIWSPAMVMDGEWAYRGDEIRKHGKKKIRIPRVKIERKLALKKVNARRRRYGLPPIKRRRGGPFS